MLSCELRNVLITFMAVLAVGAAAVPPARAADDQNLRQLDEVTITVRRLRQLGRDVVEAEDRFYRHFNALNKEDAYDIRCRRDKPIGTIIPRRECRPQFLIDTAAHDGEQFHEGLMRGSAGNGVNRPVAALQMEWMRRERDYRRVVREVTLANPELRALAEQWGHLQIRYEEQAARLAATGAAP